MDSAGRVVVAGDWASVAGTTANNIARWNTAWGSLRDGGVNGDAYTLARAGGGALVVGGRWANVGGGTSAPGIARYSVTETWGSLGGGQVGTVIAAAITPGQDVYGVASSGVSQGTVVRVRPGAVDICGSVTFLAAMDFPERTSILALSDGRVLAAPTGSIFPGYAAPFGYAIWNGYSWLPPDMKFITGNGTAVYALAQDAAGTVYVGGGFNGTAVRASLARVVNRGMGDSYPVLRVRNTGNSAGRMYQLLNITTGDDLYFDLILGAGEQATLDLRPESLNFTSSVKGTIVGAILGGSNLSTWRLAPGTNTVSFFADSADIRADLFWRPRHISADGGAEPTL